MQCLKLLSYRRVVNGRRSASVSVCQAQTKALQKLSLKDSKSYPINAITKKPAKPPFLKNLFVGVFDPEVLYFPEAGETDRYLALESIIPQAEEFFKTTLDPHKIDKEGLFSEDLISGLKDLGLFGNSLPSQIGGLDHSYSEYARLIEAASIYPPLSFMLVAHQIYGAKALFRHGTQPQIMKYLPGMASGELTASFCACEPDIGMDFSAMVSLAELSKDETYYYLNGTKSWVVNASQADVFIVAAPTETNAARRKLNNALTMFIVDKSTQGIYVQPREETLGGKGLSVCEVKFEDVKIPEANVLGKVGKGFDVCQDILHSEAHLHGSIATGFLKKLFSETVNHVINYRQYNRNLMDVNSVKKKIAEISMKIYAVESMTYLTTSFLDQYDEPDCELESLVTKMYATQATQQVVNECLELLGSKANLVNFPYEQYLRDSLMEPFFNVSLDFTDIYVAATGLNYAGPHLQNYISKLRNPLYYPATGLKLFLETQRNLNNDPKLTLHLNEYLHPSLKDVSILVEKAILRFKFSILIALSQDGLKITDNHIVLKRLSEMLMLIYAMIASVARASRSYCIGTRNSDHEMMMAECFVRSNSNRINTLATEINAGPFGATDLIVGKLADNIFKHKGHATEHPLRRNII